MTPFVIADGEFHDYRFEVVAGQATFLIDGITVASSVAPVNDAMNAGYYNVLFGPVAGRSRSETELEYFCYTVAPTLLPVGIDVKPGSLRNSINTTAEGRIPVAILSTPSFDAIARTAIDSLRFGRTGDESSLDFCNSSGEDVNGDGLPDLVCHFSTPRTSLQLGDASAMLKGWTIDGIPVKGAEAVRIVR
ncbi:MAG: hypothetical protein Q8O42_22565 [Acidobacteriota bacterium]|nr:hypothetical protein [Acidobacteriota bacterium]